MAFLFSNRRELVRKGLASDKQRRRRAPPEWLQFFHTSRFITSSIALGTLAAVVVIIIFSQQEDEYFLIEGQIAPRAIFSQIPFRFEDEEGSRMARKAAGEATPPVYQIRSQDIARDAALFASQLEELGKLNLKDLSKADRERIAQTWNQRLGSTLDAGDISRLIALPKKTEIAETVKSALLEVARRGIVEPERFSNPNLNLMAYTTDAPGGSREPELRRPSSFYRVDVAREEFDKLLVKQLPAEERFIASVEKATRGILRPNLNYDEQATERAKNLSQDKVPPVMSIYDAGDALVIRGEKIGKRHMAILKAHSEEKHKRETAEHLAVQRWGRTAILCTLFAFALLVLHSQRSRNRPTSNREYALLATAVILQLLIARGVLELSARTGWPAPGLVPFLMMPAFAPMLIAILTNNRRANLMALIQSFLLSMIADNNFPVLIYSAVTGIAAVYLAQGIRTRFQIIKAGLGAGVAGILCVGAYAVYLQLDFNSAVWRGAASVAGGLASALIISSVLPVFESLFKVTTDLRWLELTDLNHPLLRRMFMEAPGTYHHSLAVANLAEAATEAIGGNSLQSRVCSLFHDIGKLYRPEYFAENIRTRESPHDHLAPHMSALIISSHVKDGVNLAMEHHLNREIIEVISEHHGTSTILYFFHRAKQQELDAIQGSKILNLPEDDVPRVEEETYRYPGPKPQTRESAVISLADAVEGASRSLVNPTPQKIEAMIREIIFAKQADGQLDECSLSMNDLNKIVESFTFTLVNMLHARVSYPKDEPEPEKPAPETAPAFP